MENVFLLLVVVGATVAAPSSYYVPAQQLSPVQHPRSGLSSQYLVRNQRAPQFHFAGPQTEGFVTAASGYPTVFSSPFVQRPHNFYEPHIPGVYDAQFSPPTAYYQHPGAFLSTPQFFNAAPVQHYALTQHLAPAAAFQPSPAKKEEKLDGGQKHEGQETATTTTEKVEQNKDEESEIVEVGQEQNGQIEAQKEQQQVQTPAPVADIGLPEVVDARSSAPPLPPPPPPQQPRSSPLPHPQLPPITAADFRGYAYHNDFIGGSRSNVVFLTGPEAHRGAGVGSGAATDDAPPSTRLSAPQGDTAKRPYQVVVDFLRQPHAGVENFYAYQDRLVAAHPAPPVFASHAFATPTLHHVPFDFVARRPPIGVEAELARIFAEDAAALFGGRPASGKPVEAAVSPADDSESVKVEATPIASRSGLRIVVDDESTEAKSEEVVSSTTTSTDTSTPSTPASTNATVDPIK